MTNQSYHTITRCNWDTTFDSKLLAYEFQTKISNWSKYHLQRQVNYVLDAICPKGQTIKIKQLELNLGVIAYEDFIQKLPKLLKDELELQLRNMIMYPKNGSKAIEVIPEDEHQINIISDFLLQGVVQWNYLSTYRSIHHIISLQLAQNTLGVIELIKKIGNKEAVRKRIALQFKDHTVKAIIKGLEPNNYEKIIAFSDEIIKIQEKEPIVQSSTKDLRQNLWFWILNYLFNERGTLFNTIAFFRSNLQQIANHFNLTLDVLLELLDEALEKITPNKNIEKGFVLILKTIIKDVDKTVLFTSVVTDKQKQIFWKKLTNYFTDPLLRSSSTEKNTFNELVLSLSKAQPQQFQKLCLAVKPSHWSSIINDLIPEAIEALLMAIAPQQASKLLQHITFLASLKTNISRQQFYDYAIQYALLKSKTSFLAYIITEASKAHGVSKIHLLKTFVQTQVPQTHRTAKNVAIYNAIKALYITEIESTTTLHVSNSLETLLDTKEKASNFNSINEQLLLRCFDKAAKDSWNFLRTHFVNVDITEQLTTTAIKHILKQRHSVYLDSIKNIETVIKQCMTEFKVQASTLHSIKNHLYKAAFNVLFKSENLNVSKFIVALIEALKLHLMTNGLNDVENCLQIIFNRNTLKTLGLPEASIHQIQKLSHITSKQNGLEQIQFLVVNQNLAQYKVAAILEKHIHSKTLESKALQNLAPQLIRYFLEVDMAFQEKCITDYSIKVMKAYPSITKSELKSKLNTCFWQTIADYRAYKGRKDVFIECFKKAILYLYSDAAEVLKKQANYQLALNATVANINSGASQSLLPTEIQLLNSNPPWVSEQYKFSKKELINATRKGILELEGDCAITNTTYPFKTLLILALEFSAEAVLNIIKKDNITNAHIKHLQNHADFEQFIALIAHNAPKGHPYIFKEISTLFHILKTVEPKLLSTLIYHTFWTTVIAIIQTKTKTITPLITTVFNAIGDLDDVNSSTVLELLQQNKIEIPPTLKTKLTTKHKKFQLVAAQKAAPIAKDIVKCIAAQQLEVLCKTLLINPTIPSWFYHEKPYTAAALLTHILKLKPLVFLKAYRAVQLTEEQMQNLETLIDFSALTTVLKALYPTQTQQLSSVEVLYKCMDYVKINGLTTAYLQQVLLKKVLKAWSTHHWKIIDSSHLWNELIWEFCTKRQIDKINVLKGFEAIKAILPKPLQITFMHVSPKKNQLQTSQFKINTKTKMPNQTTQNNNAELLSEGISVPNAGIVLLNTYFIMLFERLGIIKNKAFKSNEDQIDAIHYLQFIVTGHSHTEESFLALNKLLCGVPVNQPITNGIEISANNKKLIEGLITAAIGHWTSIGETSIDGFRGNWLVREGLLKAFEDRWELTVEKRAYDILLNQSPYSFSIIKHPWMPKPLHVIWPY